VSIWRDWPRKNAEAVKFVPTELPEVLIVEPDVHRDARGFFLETHHQRKYEQGGIAERFVQDNHSRSLAGTVRGLHGQRRRPQGKLVRVACGEIFDVAVDARRGSPRFGCFTAVRLSGEDFRQLWVPPGFLHGFAVLTEAADVLYKCTGFYDPEDEVAVAWNDPAIGIPWPVRNPVLSERDLHAPSLAEIEPLLPAWEGPSG
jgi:dTDP-4-dehydrorhamnose 3,5-epimerase